MKQIRFKGHFGTNVGRSGRQKGSKMGAKRESKSIPNEIKSYQKIRLVFDRMHAHLHAHARTSTRSFDRSGIDSQARKAPQREPKWSLKRSKMEHRIQYEKRCLPDPLGSVLGLSCVVLGSILRSKIIKIHVCFKCFRENQRF